MTYSQPGQERKKAPKATVTKNQLNPFTKPAFNNMAQINFSRDQSMSSLGSE